MNDTLLTVLAQVSEQMAFLTPTGPGAETVPVGPVVIVRFTGPATGVVTIAASQELADALARNLLALDTDVPVAPADAGDALRELANIAAGNVLPLVHGDGEYVLQAPDAGQWPDQPGEVAYLECAEGTLAISCALQ